MAEQMAMMSEPFVMEASNCWKATIGLREKSAMARPAVMSTSLVSYRLMRA